MDEPEEVVVFLEDVEHVSDKLRVVGSLTDERKASQGVVVDEGEKNLGTFEVEADLIDVAGIDVDDGTPFWDRLGAGATARGREAFRQEDHERLLGLEVDEADKGVGRESEREVADPEEADWDVSRDVWHDNRLCERPGIEGNIEHHVCILLKKLLYKKKFAPDSKDKKPVSGVAKDRETGVTNWHHPELPRQMGLVEDGELHFCHCNPGIFRVLLQNLVGKIPGGADDGRKVVRAEADPYDITDRPLLFANNCLRPSADREIDDRLIGVDDQVVLAGLPDEDTVAGRRVEAFIHPRDAPNVIDRRSISNLMRDQVADALGDMDEFVVLGERGVQEIDAAFQ
jgi:hypothetical protein